MMNDEELAAYLEESTRWWDRWVARKPRKYQMGWCDGCKKSYRLPLSADPALPANSRCGRCFAAEMKALSDELANVSEKRP